MAAGQGIGTTTSDTFGMHNRYSIFANFIFYHGPTHMGLIQIAIRKKSGHTRVHIHKRFKKKCQKCARKEKL